MIDMTRINEIVEIKRAIDRAKTAGKNFIKSEIYYDRNLEVLRFNKYMTECLDDGTYKISWGE